jgi:hypothetical protein
MLSPPIPFSNNYTHLILICCAYIPSWVNENSRRIMHSQFPESALTTPKGTIRGVMENAKACTLHEEVSSVGKGGKVEWGMVEW